MIIMIFLNKIERVKFCKKKVKWYPFRTEGLVNLLLNKILVFFAVFLIHQKLKNSNKQLLLIEDLARPTSLPRPHPTTLCSSTGFCWQVWHIPTVLSAALLSSRGPRPPGSTRSLTRRPAVDPRVNEPDIDVDLSSFFAVFSMIFFFFCGRWDHSWICRQRFLTTAPRSKQRGSSQLLV